MALKTIWLYLAGNRDAVDRMARDKSAVWYGLFFVLLSGVAREYDQESLLHQPLLFVAPLLLSAPLALVYYGYLKLKHLPRRKPGGLRSFYGLFWMTAPLAWLYALPVEYLFSPLTALKINAGLLALVALWRVVLFARVVSRLLQQRFWQILSEILWGGSIMVFAAMFFYSLSLTEIMGGTVHSSETALKAQIAEWTMATTFGLAILLLPVQFFRGKPRMTFPVQDTGSPFHYALPALLIALSAVLLAVRQPALYRTQHLFNLLNHRDTVSEGMDYMSRFEPGDFAHTWSLPPAPRSGPMRLWMAGNMLEALNAAHAPWIGERLVAYLDEYISQLGGTFFGSDQLLDMISQLPVSPGASELLVKHREKIADQIDSQFSYVDAHRLDLLRKVQARLSVEEDPSFIPLISKIQQHVDAGQRTPTGPATP